jgi:hypothetical protein
MSFTAAVARPVKIIYRPRRILEEIAENPRASIAFLFFALVVSASISLDILISLPRIEIVNAFKLKIPTPTIDTRFVVARQVAYFFLSLGVLVGIYWMFSAVLRKRQGNIISVLSTVMNASLILLIFILAGALISLYIPPSTIVVYGYEARDVGFSEFTVSGEYFGVEVPEGVRRDLVVNGSVIQSPRVFVSSLRAEIIDSVGRRVNLTALSDEQKRAILSSNNQSVILVGVIFSEGEVVNRGRLAVPFNISLMVPTFLNWSSFEVVSYNYIDATIIGLQHMTEEEALLNTIRRALSPIAWLWISGLGAYSLNIAYGIGVKRAIAAWLSAFVIMLLLGLV